MKIVHVIPSAFNYFNDIRAKAFTLAEDLSALGFENEIYTIQFGEEPTRAVKKEIQTTAPDSNFEGKADLDQALAVLEAGDIIHLHCPLFGVAGKIVDFKTKHPDVKLVVTYYRPVRLVDFFSIIILVYNAIFWRKIKSVADMALNYSEMNKEKVAPLTQDVDGVKLKDANTAFQTLNAYELLLK